jgi:hypothetical protein
VSLVDADAVQPGEELRLALEASDSPPRADERLLGYLLGLVAVAQEAQNHCVEAVGVPAHELFECVAIAALRAQHQVAVGISHRVHAPTWAGRHMRHSLPAPGRKQGQHRRLRYPWILAAHPHFGHERFDPPPRRAVHGPPEQLDDGHHWPGDRRAAATLLL